MTIPELILLGLAILVALSIVWSTLQTGISPTKSTGLACRSMLALIDEPSKGALIDLGSGWGTLVIPLAKKYPNHQVIGYELSWFPWFISIVRKYCLRLNNLTIYRNNFEKADLGNAAVLFCYLFPGGMQSLHLKLQRELSKDVVVVSNTFAFPSCKPEKVIKLKDFYNTPIYLYLLNPKGLSSEATKIP